MYMCTEIYNENLLSSFWLEPTQEVDHHSAWQHAKETWKCEKWLYTPPWLTNKMFVRQITSMTFHMTDSSEHLHSLPWLLCRIEEEMYWLLFDIHSCNWSLWLFSHILDSRCSWLMLSSHLAWVSPCNMTVDRPNNQYKVMPPHISLTQQDRLD